MRVVLLVTCVILAALPAVATTIHVPEDQPTIAAGIAAASAGDTVLVACGTYFESNVVIEREITLLGEEPGCVVIDGHGERILSLLQGSGSTRVERLVFAKGGDLHTSAVLIDRCASQITDCVIRKDGDHGIQPMIPCGPGDVDYGMGLEIRNATLPILTRCAIVGHAGFTNGGGSLVYYSDVKFLECRIANNIAFDGAGVAVEYSDVLFDRCEFLGNCADGSPISGVGGGLNLNGSAVVVDSCVFRDNVSDLAGGGVYAQSSTLTVRSSVFETNVVNAGRGGGLYANVGTTLDLSYCRFEGNSAYEGGGLRLNELAPFTIDQCVFIGNWAYRGGGGAAFRFTSPTLNGALFLRNETGEEGIGGAVLGTGEGTTVVFNCTLAGNVAALGGHGVAAEAGATVHLLRSIVAFGAGASATFEASGHVILECSNVYDPPFTPFDPIAFAAFGEDGNFSADPLFCDLAGSDVSIADDSWCLPAGNECGQLVGAVGQGCDSEGVYVTTSPQALHVTGDGELKTAAGFFEWTLGSTHEIGVPTPQELVNEVQYNFLHWDDGGAVSHDITVWSPSQFHTATFDSLFHLRMRAEGNGTVVPGTLWLPPDTTVEITAIPDSGWVFHEWVGSGEGSYTGLDQTASVVMTRPVEEVAFFLLGKPVVFESTPPGLIFRESEQAHLTPVEFLWGLGLHRYVEMDSLQSTGPGRRERFLEWSNGQPRRHLYFVLDTEPDTVRATFATEYELTFEQTKGGHAEPGDTWWPAESSVVIEAVPDFGWAFQTWVGNGEGSYTGPENPATIVMNGPILQRAVFSPLGTGYDFTISASDTDPDVHVSAPTGDLRNIYLWMTCNERGLAAFEGAADGTLAPLAFVPANGVLNAGSASELLLAVPGCPTGPDIDFLLGYWVVHDGGGSLCLGPSEANGILGAVDCGWPIPDLWPLRVTGFSSDGTPPCFEGTNGCFEGPVPVGLTQLRAVAEDRAVQLSWFSSADRNYDGFWIYRGDFPEVLVKLTSEPWRGEAPHEYLDEAVEPNRTYFYQVGGIGELGREELSELVEVTTPDWTPILTQLSRIRPNPFVQTSEIEFTVAQGGPVRLSIYDISGRLIRTLLDGELPAGDHATSWDGTNAAGERVTGGVYFTRLEAAGAAHAKKTVFLGRR